MGYIVHNNVAFLLLFFSFPGIASQQARLLPTKDSGCKTVNLLDAFGNCDHIVVPDALLPLVQGILQLFKEKLHVNQTQPYRLQENELHQLVYQYWGTIPYAKLIHWFNCWDYFKFHEDTNDKDGGFVDIYYRVPARSLQFTRTVQEVKLSFKNGSIIWDLKTGQSREVGTIDGYLRFRDIIKNDKVVKRIVHRPKESRRIVTATASLLYAIGGNTGLPKMIEVSMLYARHSTSQVFNQAFKAQVDIEGNAAELMYALYAKTEHKRANKSLCVLQ